MKREEGELARLRRAFASVSAAPPGPALCPAPEKIWEAVSGQMPATGNREIVDHTAACASCAEDWRLAAALQRPATGTVIQATERFTARQRLRNWGIAAAAALAVAVVGIQMQQTKSEVIYRGDQSTIQSLVTEGQALPRDRFLLRWQAAEAAGATYDVEVSTEDLRVLASADDLREPELLVPQSALAGVPPGTRLLWKVDAELPDGGHVGSATFVTPVQ